MRDAEIDKGIGEVKVNNVILPSNHAYFVLFLSVENFSLRYLCRVYGEIIGGNEREASRSGE
jgi:hypothetical protein